VVVLVVVDVVAVTEPPTPVLVVIVPLLVVPVAAPPVPVLVTPLLLLLATAPPVPLLVVLLDVPAPHALEAVVLLLVDELLLVPAPPVPLTTPPSGEVQTPAWQVPPGQLVPLSGVHTPNEGTGVPSEQISHGPVQAVSQHTGVPGRGVFDVQNPL